MKNSAEKISAAGVSAPAGDCSPRPRGTVSSLPRASSERAATAPTPPTNRSKREHARRSTTY